MATLLDEVTSISYKAIDLALEMYTTWAGELSYDYVPESLLQVQIAQGLYYKFEYITLESSPKFITEWCGKQFNLTRNGRVDIVCWKDDNRPQCLIEVKKVWGNIEIKDDVLRLREFIDQNSDIECGVVIVYSSAMDKKTLKERFKLLAINSCTSIFEQRITKKVYEDKKFYWGVGFFVVN